MEYSSAMKGMKGHNSNSEGSQTHCAKRGSHTQKAVSSTIPFLCTQNPCIGTENSAFQGLQGRWG